MKGKNLFITGASMLRQTVLGKKKGKTRVVETMMESIEKAEDLLASRRFETAFALLDSVKQTLKRESGTPGAPMRSWRIQAIQPRMNANERKKNLPQTRVKRRPIATTER